MKDNILNEVNEIRKMMGLISEESNVDACDRVYDDEDIEPSEDILRIKEVMGILIETKIGRASCRERV